VLMKNETKFRLT